MRSTIFGPSSVRRPADRWGFWLLTARARCGEWSRSFSPAVNPPHRTSATNQSVWASLMCSLCWGAISVCVDEPRYSHTLLVPLRSAKGTRKQSQANPAHDIFPRRSRIALCRRPVLGFGRRVGCRIHLPNNKIHIKVC